MISRHCGERLFRTASSPYIAVWRCPVCRKRFKQALRGGEARRAKDHAAWLARVHALRDRIAAQRAAEAAAVAAMSAPAPVQEGGAP